MLCILRIIMAFFVFSFICISAETTEFSSNLKFLTKTGFTVNESRCVKCDQGPQKDLPLNRLKDTLDDIQINLTSHQDSNDQICLFIDTKCKFTHQALAELIKFKKENKSWEAKVIVLGDAEGFRNFILQNKEVLNEGIPFSNDVQNILRDQFQIEIVPSFVIQKGGVYYKIAGQPFLADIVKELKAS